MALRLPLCQLMTYFNNHSVLIKAMSPMNFKSIISYLKIANQFLVGQPLLLQSNMNYFHILSSQYLNPLSNVNIPNPFNRSSCPHLSPLFVISHLWSSHTSKESSPSLLDQFAPSIYMMSNVSGLR